MCPATLYMCELEINAGVIMLVVNNYLNTSFIAIIAFAAAGNPAK